MEGKLVRWSARFPGTVFTGRRGQRQLCEGQILLQGSPALLFQPVWETATSCQNSSIGSEFTLGTHQFNPLLVLLKLLSQLCQVWG